jgi:hypothetical protein
MRKEEEKKIMGAREILFLFGLWVEPRQVSFAELSYFWNRNG